MLPLAIMEIGLVAKLSGMQAVALAVAAVVMLPVQYADNNVMQ